MSLGSGGPSLVRIFPDHGAACLVDSDVRRTRNGSTGGGGSLAAGQLRFSPTTRRAPLRSQGQLDKVGILWLPSFEPFGLSSRSCCSTGRLMRSSSLSVMLRIWGFHFFLPRDTQAVGNCFKPGGAGAGQDKRLWHRRLCALRRRPELGGPNNKLSYSVTAGVMLSRLAKIIKPHDCAFMSVLWEYDKEQPGAKLC
jgi:hypothetical protein